MKAMKSTSELLDLAESISLKGAEFKEWYDKQMAQAQEERAAICDAKKQQIALQTHAKREEFERETRARREKLERETRAKKEQLELEMREKKRLLEIEMREKKRLLELEYEDLQQWLERENAEYTWSESQSSQPVDEVCSESSYIGSDLNLRETDPVPRHDLSLEKETLKEYDREVNSQKTRRLDKLIEAQECFVSMEQERSIQSKGYFETCERSSALYSEVGLPLNSSAEGAIKGLLGNAGECHNESSDVAATYCFGPLEIATDATDMVFHHDYNLPIQRDGLCSREIVDDAFRRILEQNAKALVEEQRVELQCRSAICDNEGNHDDPGRRVESIDEQAIQKAEGMESEPEGSNGPAGYCTRKDADWCSLASSVEEVASVKMSQRLAAYELKQGVRGKDEMIQAWLYWCAWRQRLRLAYRHSSVYACDFEVGNLVIHSFRFIRAYGREFFHWLPIPYSCQMVRAVKRLVRDAIT